MAVFHTCSFRLIATNLLFLAVRHTVETEYGQSAAEPLLWRYANWRSALWMAIRWLCLLLLPHLLLDNVGLIVTSWAIVILCTPGHTVAIFTNDIPAWLIILILVAGWATHRIQRTS
jgi:hypothetical protein